jgi:hypothetical protein
MKDYEVVVGNVGCFFYPDEETANREFDLWVKESQESPESRAFGEDVGLIHDGDIIRDHFGHLTGADEDFA